MHRSASASRVSGEFVVQSSSVAPSLDGADQLPTYDPLSHAAKKERSRLRSAENAVHLIPLVLIFCAVILWFFSSPVNSISRDGSIVARIEGLRTDINIDNARKGKAR